VLVAIVAVPLPRWHESKGFLVGRAELAAQVVANQVLAAAAAVPMAVVELATVLPEIVLPAIAAVAWQGSDCPALGNIVRKNSQLALLWERTLIPTIPSAGHATFCKTIHPALDPS
jgi:hypothetical protein